MMTIFNMLLLKNSLVFLLVLILVQQTHQVCASSTHEPWLSSLAGMVAKPGCKDTCGNLTIPYPFGIGKGCYFDDPFEITCSNTKKSSPLAYSPWLFTSINYFSMDAIKIDMSFYTSSYNKSSGKNTESIDPALEISFPDGFSISTAWNKFIAVGCDIFASLKDNDSGEILSGCASFCNSTTYNFTAASSSSCTGINGCCESPISRLPDSLVAISIQTMNTEKASWAANNCSYFTITQSGYNSTYIIDQLLSPNSSNGCPEEPPARNSDLVLEWVIGNMTCEEATKTPTYACRNNSYCINSGNGTTNTGYRCRCSHGYQGNPYFSNGCQDINECASANGNNCPHDTHCVNTLGSFYWEPNNVKRMLLVRLLLGTVAAVILILLVAGCLLLHRKLKSRKEKKAKQKFFKRNGGLLLQKRISISEGSGRAPLHMKLFQKQELEKATDNFNESRILGKGGLGTVYKGMLSDGSIVAIKKSNVVDEDQVSQFVNEIFILSQINHRHIVKVLGCCLETQVPLLVYEYISNGTLSHHLHGNTRTSIITLSLEYRLRIAREIAGALSYLHSWASSAIFHRDIKSSNILLDENFRAVISDFGLSRLVPIEKTHLTTRVGGTFGYLDPEYFRSGQLNDKSDVYAFGVVLLELLTSQRAVSCDASDSQSLVVRFRSMFKQGRLLEIVDTEIARDAEGQEMVPIVAKLAKSCLKSNARNRPSMKEVAAQLDELRLTRYDIPNADSFQENISLKSESLYSYSSNSLIEDN